MAMTGQFGFLNMAIPPRRFFQNPRPSNRNVRCHGLSVPCRSLTRPACDSADNPAKRMQSLLWRFGRLSYAQVMLPFFRIIPVGGVFLAIMIVVLAHEPPGGSHTALTPAEMPARGALMRMNEHPEGRQFLILAAVRRSDELSRLRELPDTPGRDGGKVARMAPAACAALIFWVVLMGAFFPVGPPAAAEANALIGLSLVLFSRPLLLAA